MPRRAGRTDRTTSRPAHKPKFPIHTFPDWPIRRPGDMRGLAVSDTDFRYPTRYSTTYLLLIGPFGNGELVRSDPNVATRRRYSVLTKAQVDRLQALADEIMAEAAAAFAAGARAPEHDDANDGSGPDAA